MSAEAADSGQVAVRADKWRHVMRSHGRLLSIRPSPMDWTYKGLGIEFWHLGVGLGGRITGDITIAVNARESDKGVDPKIH